MKNVDPKVEEFLEVHFRVTNIQLCSDEMIVAAMEFLEIAKFFKRHKDDFAEIKKSAAKIMFETLGTVHPDYSPESQVLTIQVMRTVLFKEGARS